MLPITREEIYLYKLAGNTIETPEPITRKELYLAKACGESVEIPEPITREETYLYKLAGGDIEIPEPITTLECLMYAVCGGVIEIQPPVTHLEWFWYNILNAETTISGILPISFTSDGTALSAWSIYGNGQQAGMPIMPDFVGKKVGDDWTIPISCAGQTTPVYLGQTPTVRKIVKLVLTGEENITSTHTDVGLFNIPVSDYLKTAGTITNICSHYQAGINVNGWSDVTDLTCRFYGNASSPSTLLYIRDSSFSTVDDFKYYLAQQHTAGTPVTVWYVLATPETAIVNEPLAKIGDYADELHSSDTTVSIPTVKGQNTFDVNTTLKPSSVTITGYISQ